MGIYMDSSILHDKGGRRLGDDRRVFSYDAHLPERRSGKDRRDGIDRRQIPRLSE